MVSNFLEQGTQESKSYWNPHRGEVRLQDQWTLSTQTLFSALQNRDHANIARSVDPRTSLLKALAKTKTDTPSLSELLALSSHRLISVVQLSCFLPIYVKQSWIRQIRVIGLKRWQASLAILEELRFDQSCAQEDYRPGHDIFDTNTRQDQDFNAEMTCIEHEFNTIEMILKYVEASSEVV